MPTKHWVPLESNPEVLDEFAAKLGCANCPSEYQFCDVFGLDPELLAMVPSPALCVLLLFPITKATEEQRDAGEAASQLAVHLGHAALARPDPPLAAAARPPPPQSAARSRRPARPPPPRISST